MSTIRSPLMLPMYLHKCADLVSQSTKMSICSSSLYSENHFLNIYPDGKKNLKNELGTVQNGKMLRPNREIRRCSGSTAIKYLQERSQGPKSIKVRSANDHSTEKALRHSWETKLNGNTTRIHTRIQQRKSSPFKLTVTVNRTCTSTCNI